ncbi:uncharacterized protein LOC127242723 [Andrographis paniculata]|uniref:uncharacterized protein LOC127242723 n=1 Tax=Andrographis paniculata TaxID=175694 RepID=UPI0021E83229|nr:uncharacterized protein LOC127242723 [Andrographis paniculata]
MRISSKGCKMQTLSTKPGHFLATLNLSIHMKQDLKNCTEIMMSSHIAPFTTTHHHPLAKPLPISRTAATHLSLNGLHLHKVFACSSSSSNEEIQVQRRSVALGLGGLVLGLQVGGGNASAARRPPPPPQQEKKDPNVSGVTAKVLASKKRKEAMKESIAKLREKGKPIKESIQEPESSQ